MCYFPQDDILLYGADMFSSSAVVFTLGLNGVALGCQDLVNNGARDISSVIHWGQEEDFLASV